MADPTGIDIVKVRVEHDGMVLDLFYATCMHCGWVGERVINLNAAQKDRLDHVFRFKCMANSRGG